MQGYPPPPTPNVRRPRKPAGPRMGPGQASGSVVLDEDSTCMVTGAARGLGCEWVAHLLWAGCAVVATVRDPEGPGSQRLREFARAVGDGRLRLVRMDVSDPASVEAAMEEVAAMFSPTGRRLDLLVNNAGVYGPAKAGQSLDSVTQADFEDVLRVNCAGPVLVAQQAARRDLLGEGSVVLNVSSKMGSVQDNGSGGTYAYRAAKAALNVCTKSLDHDLSSRGAHAVLFHPGYVQTDMTGGNGLIDTTDSVSGMLDTLLDLTFPQDEFTWYDFKGNKVPW